MAIAEHSYTHHRREEQLPITVTIVSSMIPGPGTFNVAVQTPAGNTSNVGCSSGGTSSALVLTVD